MTNTATPAPALFSIVPFTDHDSVVDPANGPYLLAGKKGYSIVKRTHWGRAIVPIKEAPTAPDIKPMLWHHLDFPVELLGQAWSFFRAIYRARHSEAMVDITYDDTHGYRLFVPPQTTSGGGVKATRTPSHYLNSQIVGTIHSHCMMSAFHSGTDTHDADEHDGLHITIGRVDSDKPEFATMVSINKIRWHFDIEELYPNGVTEVPHPTWWERQVKDPPKYDQGKHISQWASANRTRTAPPGPPQGQTTWHGHPVVTRPPISTPPSNSAIIIPNTATWDDIDHLIYELESSGKILPAIEGALVNTAIMLDEVRENLELLGYDFYYDIAKATKATASRRQTSKDLDEQHFINRYMESIS